jgi:hypothetical protein
MKNHESYRDRLYITQEDLSQASRFGHLILKRGSHEGAEDDPDIRLVSQALDIALIVSYSRPFTLFLGKNKRKEPMLPESLLAVLDKEERILHDDLLNRRNKEYAHSDASQIEVRYYTWPLGILPIGRNRFIPLTRPMVQKVVAMSDKLYLKIDELRRDLEATSDPKIQQFSPPETE